MTKEVEEGDDSVIFRTKEEIKRDLKSGLVKFRNNSEGRQEILLVSLIDILVDLRDVSLLLCNIVSTGLLIKGGDDGAADSTDTGDESSSGEETGTIEGN